MPSPPSTATAPYGSGDDRRERDSLGRDVGGMTLRGAGAASSSTASTPRSAGTASSSFAPLPRPLHAPAAALPPLPPATLTAGPPPPPLSLRAASPARAALLSDEDELPYASHGRARGVRHGKLQNEEEVDEEDEEDEPAAAKDSDPDFEPTTRGGPAVGASAAMGARRRARGSGAGAGATAARGRGKKARVAESADGAEGGDVEMRPPEEAAASGRGGARAKRGGAGARRGAGGARASLSRVPPGEGPDYAALEGGGGSASAASPPPPPTPSSSSAAAGGARAPTLSESQKRSNHILSEQKRRNAIRVGFKDLVGLLVAGEGASGVVLGGGAGGGGVAGGDDEDDEAGGGGKPGAKKRKGKGSGRGRGRRGDVSTNASKSVVLTQAASYILWLERGNAALEREVARVEGLLRDARVDA